MHVMWLNDGKAQASIACVQLLPHIQPCIVAMAQCAP